MSRQTRNAIGFVIQLVFWLTVLGFGSWYTWKTLIPMARQYIVKPQPEPAQAQQPPQPQQ